MEKERLHLKKKISRQTLNRYKRSNGVFCFYEKELKRGRLSTTERKAFFYQFYLLKTLTL